MHLVCVDCGAVVEFADTTIEHAQEAIYRKHGFQSSGHHLELRGRCPACASRMESKSKARSGRRA